MAGLTKQPIYISHRKGAKSAKVFCQIALVFFFAFLCVFAVNNRSQVLILPVQIENLLYLIISETAVLQEAGLTRAFGKTLGHVCAEFLALYAPDVLDPFAGRNIEPTFDRL